VYPALTHTSHRVYPALTHTSHQVYPALTHTSHRVYPAFSISGLSNHTQNNPWKTIIRWLFGGQFLKPFARCYQTVVCLSWLYCGQTVGWIKMKLGTQVGLGCGHIALEGDPTHPPPKGHSHPIFGPYLVWPTGWMNLDATWYGGRPRPRRPCDRWEPNSSTSPPQKEAEPPPQFLAYVYCGQTAGWIKMTLGMEAVLSADHIVLDRDPAPLPKTEGRAPNFLPISIVAQQLDASRCHLVWR